MSNADIPRVNLDSERDLAEPEERVSVSAIDAGQLVIVDGSGGVDVHGTDDTRPPLLMVARDARERGMEWGDTYPSGTKTPLLRIEGGFINLPLAAGENVTEDTPLVPDGNGGVREASTDSNGNYIISDIIGYPTEAVDNSGGSEATQIPVEVTY